MPALSFVDSDHVDYTKVLSNTAFQQWISSLPTTEVPTHSTNATKVFWINIYNGLTIQVVAESIPIEGIQYIDGGKLWTTRTFVVGNQTVPLDQKSLLVFFKDPRIHAALNCAAEGCPPLLSEPFTAFDLDAQLEAASTRWVNGSGFTYDDGWFRDSATSSSIFDWYKEDFPCDDSKPMPTYDTTEYCGVLQFIVKYSAEYRKRIGKDYHTLFFEAYDWSLNSKPWANLFTDNAAERSLQRWIHIFEFCGAPYLILQRALQWFVALQHTDPEAFDRLQRCTL